MTLSISNGGFPHLALAPVPLHHCLSYEGSQLSNKPNCVGVALCTSHVTHYVAESKCKFHCRYSEYLHLCCLQRCLIRLPFYFSIHHKGSYL